VNIDAASVSLVSRTRRDDEGQDAGARSLTADCRLVSIVIASVTLKNGCPEERPQACRWYARLRLP